MPDQPTRRKPETPKKTEVLRGTLDLMVLQTLAALGRLHGYAIADRIEQVSSGSILLNMGTLYPGLMRLEQRGLIRAEWGVTENNRKARYYEITRAGQRQLETSKREWDHLVGIMDDLFRQEA
jgi:PadR family transcriptional regulator, regulatory protein PadR